MATYLHRDTQGPCPDGYHIPTYKDWKEVYDAGVALGQWSSSNGDGMRIKLKMPFAKFRERNTGDVRTVSNDGYYWFSDYYSGSYSNAYTRILNVGSTSVNVGGFYQRPHSGCSIRPFKNIPTIPNSNWTIIYAGSNGAGIFYNSTEGVISISSDGTTWYTIADKNLGATTVYNDGATLSETNCGKFYQWGNNYGFPWTGTVTTSSTQVNASGYGPGKYYSSSTFIARGDGEFGWDSSGNRNLRGGVTDERVYDPTRIIKKFYHMGVEYKIKGGKPTPSTYTPGIYHNPSLGLISLSSDGSEWITIADKNLGATSTDINSTSSYGLYYQYGNNHGFTIPLTKTSTTRVDASNYGPSNYYDSDTFIIGDGVNYSQWSTLNSTNSANLRGDVDDTKTSRRGPCAGGFHIPSKDEWTLMTNITGREHSRILLPKAGRILSSGTGQAGAIYAYWTSSCSKYSGGTIAQGWDAGENTFYEQYTTYGFPIRPFANAPVVPDSSWTVLYQ